MGAAGAALRVGMRVFLGWGEPARVDPAVRWADERAETQLPAGRVPPTMVAPPVLLVALALAVSFLPQVAGRLVEGAGRFLDRAAYLAAVLRGAHPRLAVPATPPFTPSGVLVALLGVALAVAVAGLAVASRQRTGPLRRVGRRFAPPVRWLRRLHTGRLGDYVAWLVFGAAGYGALVALGVALSR